MFISHWWICLAMPISCYPLANFLLCTFPEGVFNFPLPIFWGHIWPCLANLLQSYLLLISPFPIGKCLALTLSHRQISSRYPFPLTNVFSHNPFPLENVSNRNPFPLTNVLAIIISHWQMYLVILSHCHICLALLIFPHAYLYCLAYFS